MKTELQVGDKVIIKPAKWFKHEYKPQSNDADRFVGDMFEYCSNIATIKHIELRNGFVAKFRFKEYGWHWIPRFVEPFVIRDNQIILFEDLKNLDTNY